jgi:CBS domain-containing membrane protein
MMTATKPLLSLTAADLMSEDVTAIPQHMSLQGAAHILAQFDISGAPVVDDEGRCIGVLSAHDFVVWAEKGKRTARIDEAHGGAGVHCPWQVMEIQALPMDEVSCYMTPDPVTVAPSTSVAQLVRKMRDAHIHRVIVVNAEGRPVGIVSSTDVVAAVAQDASHGTDL